MAGGNLSSQVQWYTAKKLNDFPSPAGMSLTKLSLDENNLIIPAHEEFG
jgi:hypothetical protein